MALPPTTEAEADVDKANETVGGSSSSTAVPDPAVKQASQADAAGDLVPAEQQGQAPERLNRRAAKALVAQEKDFAESLSEDGRLLKMFVVRDTHLKPDAKLVATKDWLIRESFYDRYLEEFVKRYSRESTVVMSEEEARRRQNDLIDVCSLALRGKPEVDKLELSVQEARGDVMELRDTLLLAIDNLITPRRRPQTLGDALNKMSPEALEEIKNRRQQRLRLVIHDCLQGIWLSGKGGEVLNSVIDKVRSMIQKFEARMDDMREATGTDTWMKLKGLVCEIEGELPQAAPKRRQKEVEGKGTKLLVQKAIEDLGGKAITQEILAWIENHPEVIEEFPEVKLNMNVVTKSDKRAEDAKGSKYTVWTVTVRSVLSQYFNKSDEKRPDGFYYWTTPSDGEQGALQDHAAQKTLKKRAPRSKKAVADGEPLPIVDAAEAGEAEAEVEAEADAQPAPKRRKKKVAADE